MRPMFVTAHPPLAARSGGIPCPPLAAIRRAVAYPAVPARPGEGGTAPAALRRSPRMSIQTPPASRGHRVREFVGAYRTLRNEHGQPVRLSTLALSEPRIAAAALAPLLEHEAVEIFGVACLSTRHRLLAWHVLSRGTRSGTSVSLPDVFVPACLTPRTTALLVAHNHPSGDPAPSADDARLTDRLAHAADVIDIPLLDHVIVGSDGRYYSFREAGLLPARGAGLSRF